MEKQEKVTEKSHDVEAEHVKKIGRACTEAVAYIKQVQARPAAGRPKRNRSRRSK